VSHEYQDPGNSEHSGLVDVWRALVRRRTFVAATGALFAGAGALHVLLTAPVYTYTTIVEIATTYYPGDRPQLVEPVETIREKVVDAYVPEVVRRHLKDSGEPSARTEIKVEVPRNSRILVLRSRGPANKAEIYEALHGDVVKQIREDHAGIAAVAENQLTTQMKVLQQSLSFLAEGAERIESHLRRLEVEQKMLSKQIAETKRAIQLAETESAIAAANGNVEGATIERVSGARTMALLMRANELHHSRIRLAELEGRANVGLANDRNSLLTMLSANQRSQTEERARLEELRIRLANTRPTKAVTSAVRSLEPVGPGRRTIFLLWVLGGLVLAIIGLLFFEVIQKAREETSRSKAT